MADRWLERAKVVGRRQSYLLVCVGLVAVGLLLLQASGTVTNWAQMIGSSLLAVGLISAVWQIAVDHWQTRRVSDAVKAALNETRPGLGLTDTRIGEVGDEKFRDLIGKARTVSAVCLFDTRWREAWSKDLIQLLKRGGTFRLCVPDPDDEPLMAILARRHGRHEDPSRFQQDVRQLLDDIHKHTELGKGRVELRVSAAPGPSYTAYLFERRGGGGGAITRMYGHRMNPGSELTEQTLTRPGALYDFYKRDFEALWAASTDYPRTPPSETARKIAVIGPGDSVDQNELLFAEDVGELLTQRGALVLCGGRGGVMEAVARGATVKTGQVQGKGIAHGILPGLNPAAGNQYLTVREATGLGEARNLLLIDRADAVIAVGCNPGTLIEAAYAHQQGKIVVSFNFWDGDRLELLTEPVTTAEDAVNRVCPGVGTTPPAVIPAAPPDTAETTVVAAKSSS